MGLSVKVGFDADVIGEYRVRDGRIEAVAPSDGAREELERRLESYLRRMVTDDGADPEALTAEDVLRWIPEHTAQGRNWTELADDDEVTEDVEGGDALFDGLARIFEDGVGEGGAGSAGRWFPVER